MSKKTIENILNHGQEDTDNQWISISDIMTVLMVIFLFVSILYIKRIQYQMKLANEANQAISRLNKEYIDYKQIMYDQLNKEFSEDLKKWDAALLKDPLIIRFLSPEIMFHSGKSTIQPHFKNILRNFCPRYFAVLNRFKKIIDEIRIEGHTSFEWHGARTKTEAYFKNLQLSQDRTVSVLQYCVTIRSLQPDIKDWTIKNLTANGLSSSKPLCVSDSNSCRVRNRRVEFRVQIDSEDVLDKINQSLKVISRKKNLPPVIQK